jgi:DNA-binding PadR family transcriptional regulator
VTLTALGPFADAGLLLLASLADGPKHGYAMLQDIESLTGIHIGPGTLYTTLTQLQQRGWIEALPAEERRRPYRLTEAGSTVLRDQLLRLQGFTAVGLQRLGHAQTAEGGLL